ncbi:MAG: hypothetical protein WCY26_08610 [Thiohalobacteraceae bacterium]|nr:hypothetical protein [Gammaproteobacteria bacterium]
MWIQSDIQPLRRLEKRVDAACYNQVRIALLRLPRPLRVALQRPRHRGLELVLDDDRWLCVDTGRNDLPVLAWHGFDTHGRSALHEPVVCRLDLYHIHAGLVMGTVLDDLEHILRERLTGAGSP